MREKLIAHIDELFAEAPSDSSTKEMKQEILNDALEHYDDLIKSGVNEREAFDKVANQIGDLNELFEGSSKTSSSDKKSIEKIDEKTEKSDYEAVIPAKPGKKYQPEFVNESSQVGKDKDYKVIKTVRRVIGAVIWPIAIIFYLAFSFITKSWATSWLIFIIALCFDGIISGITTLITGEEGDKDER